jgi:hypothetical protein
VNYADLGREPDAVLKRVLNGASPGAPSQPPVAVHSGDRSSLDQSDVETIHAICSEAAGELGLGGD